MSWFLSNGPSALWSAPTCVFSCRDQEWHCVEKVPWKPWTHLKKMLNKLYKSTSLKTSWQHRVKNSTSEVKQCWCSFCCWSEISNEFSWTCMKMCSKTSLTFQYCSQVLKSLSFPFRVLWISRTLGLRCDSVPTPGLSCDRSHGEVLIPIQGAQLSMSAKHLSILWSGEVSKQIWTSYNVTSCIESPSNSYRSELNQLCQGVNCSQVWSANHPGLHLHHVRFQTI